MGLIIKICRFFVLQILAMWLLTPLVWADPKIWFQQQQQAQLEKKYFYWSLMADKEISGRPTDPKKALTFAGQFKQKTNHNDTKDGRTFLQRFWVNKSFANNEVSPTLYYICGEGECTEASQYLLYKHAKQLQANIVVLEHRYYGQSQPFGDLKTENLQFLTVEQSLKDFVSFKKYAEEKYKLRGSWVTIGGSYPGVLSALLRTQYPDEFSGALASSAPVTADNDFQEYDQHVAKMLGPSCAIQTRQIMDEITEQIKNKVEFEKIKKEFGAPELKDEKDFLYLLADTVAIAVQYGWRNQFCKYIADKGDQGLRVAVQEAERYFGRLVLLSAQYAENTDLTQHSGAIGMRQWLYQSCTEFGFWQNASSDDLTRARARRINMSYHRAICKRLFNINDLAPTDITNEKYYAGIMNSLTTNILFTNGSEDPWIRLSISEETSNKHNHTVFDILNAAHCDDLDEQSNNPYVKMARDKFIELSKLWLAQ